MRQGRQASQLRVAICGAHSTGKTTLINAMRQIRPEVEVIGGVVRGLIRRGYRFGLETDMESMMAYACAQFEQERRAASSAAPVILSDRVLLDGVAYVQANQGWVGAKQWKSRLQIKFLRAVAEQELMFYDAVVHVPIEFPLEDDDVRPTSEEYQRRVDDRLRLLTDSISEQLPIRRVSGTLEQRLEQLNSILIGGRDDLRSELREEGIHGANGIRQD